MESRCRLVSRTRGIRQVCYEENHVKKNLVEVVNLYGKNNSKYSLNLNYDEFS